MREETKKVTYTNIARRLSREEIWRKRERTIGRMLHEDKGMRA